MLKQIWLVVIFLIPFGIMVYGRLFFWIFADDMKNIYKKALREMWEENNRKNG